jgi:hypothetical protein
MRILWTRSNDKIRFNRPFTWFCLGVRGSGKSSFLEHVACQYLRKDAVVFDLFGSRDGEGLAWLRSPYAKNKKILLLHGENVDVDASFPVKSVESVKLLDFEEYDIVVSASPLYLSIDQEFSHAAKLTDLLYKRLYYKRLVYMICREAANFYYSRLKVSDNQIFAKSQMIYLIREARHMGIALGLDSVRFYAIDIDIRNLADYMILKAQGVQGLAKDLSWLYSYFNPSTIRNMKPQYFFIITRKGALGLGEFPFHEWHKREKENILKAVGVKVEYGELVEAGEYRGTFRTVGDKEHSEMIRLYIEEELSIDRMAERLGRSSRTPHEHIKQHNKAVEHSGFCPSCRRTKSPFETEVATRKR